MPNVLDKLPKLTREEVLELIALINKFVDMKLAEDDFCCISDAIDDVGSLYCRGILDVFGFPEKSDE